MRLMNMRLNATISRQEVLQQTDRIGQLRVTEKDKNKFDTFFMHSFFQTY